MRALGVSIANGVLYLASLEAAPDDQNVLGRPAGGTSRIIPSDVLADPFRITDLRDRIKQDIRSMSADRVGLVATRQFVNLKYAAALSRITAMSALMIACAEIDVHYAEIKTSDIGRRIDMPAKSLERTPYQSFGFGSIPRYWVAGLAESYAVAAYMVSDE